jgi:hypothetical protein
MSFRRKPESNLPNGVGNPEAVSQVAKCFIGVGRVPDCAMRKEKPDTELSAFCVTRGMTLEADLLTVADILRVKRGRAN